MSAAPIPASILPELFDVVGGELIWRERPRLMFVSDRAHNCWNARYAGAVAFSSVHRGGYRYGEIFSQRHLAHRVIWALAHGEWPVGQIDHIDGNPANNAIENLRCVTPTENRRNCKRHRNNTSGVSGVGRGKGAATWRAEIGVGGKTVKLGSFGCKTAAILARKAAERKLGYHPNHGREA